MQQSTSTAVRKSWLLMVDMYIEYATSSFYGSISSLTAERHLINAMHWHMLADSDADRG